MVAKVSKSKQNYDEEIARSNPIVEKICALKSKLSNNEIDFVFDFLLQMCLYAQTLEVHAVSIATHLLADFYEKSNC